MFSICLLYHGATDNRNLLLIYQVDKIMSFIRHLSTSQPFYDLNKPGFIIGEVHNRYQTIVVVTGGLNVFYNNIRIVDNMLLLCYLNRNIVYFEQYDHGKKIGFKTVFDDTTIKTYSYYSLAKQIVFTMFLRNVVQSLFEVIYIQPTRILDSWHCLGVALTITL